MLLSSHVSLKSSVVLCLKITGLAYEFCLNLIKAWEMFVKILNIKIFRPEGIASKYVRHIALLGLYCFYKHFFK